jgi:hypothetical protein
LAARWASAALRCNVVGNALPLLLQFAPSVGLQQLAPLCLRSGASIQIWTWSINSD